MILVLILDYKENIANNWQNLSKSYNLNTLYQVMVFLEKKKKLAFCTSDEIYILIIWVSQVAQW